MWESFVASIDVRTTYLIGGLVGWVAAAAVFILRDLHRPSHSAAGKLAWALAFCATTLLLASVRHVMPSFLLTRTMLITAGIGSFLLLMAVRALYDRPTPMGVQAPLIGLFALTVLQLPDPRHALIVVFAVQLVSNATGAILVAGEEEPHARAGRLAVLVVMVMLALAGGFRLIDMLRMSTLEVEALNTRTESNRGPLVMVYSFTSLVMMLAYIGIVYGRLLADVRHMASTDELTGLASRRYLFGHGEPWLTARGRAAHYTALMMIDVDRFKSINDRFGHEIGDRVLRHVAVVLRDAMRGDSVLARYGGEEFCAMVPVSDPAEAEAVAERVRDAVQARPFLLAGGSIEVTVSIGLACHRPGLTLREVLRTADSRVYFAKASGRNKVVSEYPVLEEAIV
jgi:diguanylate cyclase (GGDEF)-like protein